MGNGTGRANEWAPLFNTNVAAEPICIMEVVDSFASAIGMAVMNKPEAALNVNPNNFTAPAEKREVIFASDVKWDVANVDGVDVGIIF